MTPHQAAQRIQTIEEAVVRNIRDAEMDSAIAGRGIAMAQTLGPFKTAQLRKYRPGLYSRKHPRPPADPALINVQSGVLNRSWQVSQTATTGNLVTAIFNQSRSAAFIAGSGRGGSRMMRRPVEQRIAERLMPVRINNLKDAIRKALTP